MPLMPVRNIDYSLFSCQFIFREEGVCAMKASLIMVKIIQCLQRKRQQSQSDSDIFDQDSFQAFLTLIDPLHFKNTHSTANSYWSYLHSIDSYLVQHFSSRLQRNHKLLMAEVRPKHQIVALALFLAFKTHLMEELVDTIETLGEETQTFIIKLMQGIEGNIQDSPRDSHAQQTTRNLQFENECLDGLIDEALDGFNTLKKELELLEKQRIVKRGRQKHLMDEKMGLLQQMGICQFAQYSTILQNAYNQQQELVILHQNTVRLNIELEQAQKDLLKDMRNKSIEISVLDEQRHEWQRLTSNSIFLHHQDRLQHQIPSKGSNYLQILKQAQQKIKQLKISRGQLQRKNKSLKRLIKKKTLQLQQASRICQNISQ